MTIQPVNTISHGLEALPANLSASKDKPASLDRVAANPVAVSTKKQQDNVPTIDTSRMTDELNKFIEKMGVELSFSVDRDLDMVVVTVTKTGSDEVVRQIPSKEMVDLTRRLKEMEARGEAKGALVDSLLG